MFLIKSWLYRKLTFLLFKTIFRWFRFESLPEHMICKTHVNLFSFWLFIFCVATLWINILSRLYHSPNFPHLLSSLKKFHQAKNDKINVEILSELFCIVAKLIVQQRYNFYSKNIYKVHPWYEFYEMSLNWRQ